MRLGAIKALGAALLGASVLMPPVALADEATHRYSAGERVIVWASTVSPQANRQETYPFFMLPFCRAASRGPEPEYHQSLGEQLLGFELQSAGIPVEFRKEVPDAPLCTVAMTLQNALAFQMAVAANYRYTLYIDDLPVHGRVGIPPAGAARQSAGAPKAANRLVERAQDGMFESGYYLYTMRNFTIEVNGDQIVGVDVHDTNPVLLQLPSVEDDPAQAPQLPFSYSVTWVQSQTPFARRFDRYLDAGFFQHKVHSFSVFNALMLVLFLVGVVAIILMRTVRRDVSRYEKEDGLLDLERELGDEYGWKQVHGDVFRSPNYLTWFSALMGTGVQLVMVAIAVILYTIARDLYIERASIMTVTVFLYVLTCVLSGYASARFYVKHGGRNWVKTMLITALAWPGCVCAVALSVNWLSIAYQSARALPIGTLVTMAVLWFFTACPLTLVGTMLGKNLARAPDWPCRINPIPRPIPERVWYERPVPLALLSGILPFGAIFIEIHFIFSSLWTFKVYYVYGYLLLIYGILLVVTACVSVVSTYILLNAEDHRWHWANLAASGSSAVYVMLYATYYYFFRTDMHGWLQTAWYFGYTLLGCASLFIMLGAVGHFAANAFIRALYRNVKVD